MHRFPVVVRFPMHWGDMDALGHANNARFFTWFESARIEYFRRTAIAADRASGIAAILAHAQCDFVKPLYFPADIQVGARVVRVGNTSFQMEYLVERSDGADPIARGTAVVVLVDYSTMAKVTIPPDVRAAIASLEASVAQAG